MSRSSRGFRISLVTSRDPVLRYGLLRLGGSIGIPAVFSVGSAEASIGLASRLRSSDVKGERAPSSADRSPRDNLACMNCVGGD